MIVINKNSKSLYDIREFDSPQRYLYKKGKKRISGLSKSGATALMDKQGGEVYESLYAKVTEHSMPQKVYTLIAKKNILISMITWSNSYEKSY